MNFDIQTPPPFFIKPVPFVITDLVFKKKMEKIQEDYLWRMSIYDEPIFYTYLNNLIKVKRNED